MDTSKQVSLEGAHLFRIWLLDDMFRKLKRELDRYRESQGDRRQSTDHAINFCVTAWHISDWIWERFKPRLRTELLIKTKGGLQEYFKRGSVDLAVCDVIANAAKHGGRADAKPDRPDVVTILVAHLEPNERTEVEFVAPDGDLSFELRIMVNGKPRPAISVFECASAYLWRFKMTYLRPE